MLKLRFLHPADVRLSVQPGDEISVGRVTPDVQQLIDARRIDKEPVCVVVREDSGADEAHDPRAGDERAVAHTSTSRRTTRAVASGHGG